MQTNTDFERRFERAGCFWFHDGNPRRPYVRLTSGKISNGFFNGNLLQFNHPRLHGEACEALGRQALMELRRVGVSRIIGPAQGAIIPPQRVAEACNLTAAYANKKGEDDFVFDDRFISIVSEGECFCPMEDTTTTGGSLERMVIRARETFPAVSFSPFGLAICNRSGQETLKGFRIISLVARDMLSWNEGENPFTPDGHELVPPVSGKTQWNELTQDFD